MTKKDYVMIAEAVSSADIPAVHKATMASRLADVLGADNYRFDRDRFVTACRPRPKFSPLAGELA